MSRRTIATYGGHGSRVNVFTETMPSGASLVRMEYRRGGKRTTESFANTKANREKVKAAAKALAAQLAAAPAAAQRVTVADLFDRYKASKALKWRATSRPSVMYRWRWFTVAVGETTFADAITADTIDAWRQALAKAGRVSNQIRQATALVKSVWRFALARKLIPENPLEEYDNSFAKGEGALDVPEYTPEEYRRIMAQLTYRDSRQWRAWVALVLGGTLGPRQRALVNLSWPDIDLAARVVTWPAQFDKLGRVRSQPLPRAAVFALRVARVWQQRMDYRGRYVIPAASMKGRRDAHYTYSALQGRLHAACDAAGVARIRFRAMHGLRRMVVNNVLSVTGGNLDLAGKYVGDTDHRTLTRSYVKKRAGELKPVAAQLDQITMPNAIKRQRRPPSLEGPPPSGSAATASREPQVGIEPTTASIGGITGRLKDPPSIVAPGRNIRRRYRETARTHRERLAGSATKWQPAPGRRV